jgi:hypothetical protein
MPALRKNPRKVVAHANVVKIDKAIVTNLSAMNRKYGTAGVQKIQAALKNLIVKDHERGLVTRLYPLDDAAAMKQVNGKPVTRATDPRQNKNAIDAVYRAFAPDYLMILGSIDVIPHQNIKNPLYSPYDDPDKFAFGDLPYACEAKYSQRPQDFFGPTRVVGRLPDITGAEDPQYLLALLKTAAAYRSNSNAQSYRRYFGISAEVWKRSSELSLTATFGNAADMKTVPPSNAKWPNALVKRLSHFINCHGAPDDARFYGQPRSGAQVYPVALDAVYLEKKISEGTVAAAECCYGGQLFDPAYNQGQMGIGNTYLGNKAYGFFGSTTIAYGPDDHNDQADLICQYFLQGFLKGASLGRAALEARQKFAHTASMSDPSNVKTIAQFNLYADPSVAPIQQPQVTAGKVKAIAAVPKLLDFRIERAERRRDLFSRGLALAKSQPIISRFADYLPGEIVLTLEKKAAEYSMTVGRTLTFSVMEPPTAKFMPVSLIAKELFPTRVHVIFQAKGQGRAEVNKEAAKTSPPAVTGTVALIVKEVDGTIVSAQKIFSR